MSDLVDRARRIVRDYPPHIAQREQAKLIVEMADELDRLERFGLCRLHCCNTNYETIEDFHTHLRIAHKWTADSSRLS